MDNTKTAKIGIALVSFDRIGKKMAGTAIRYFELAKALSKKYKVKLFVPESCDLEIKDFEIAVFNPKNQAKQIGKNLAGFSAVIAQNLQPELLKILNAKKINFIADLYDPLLIEILEYEKDSSNKTAKNIFDFQSASLVLQLSFANHILFANNRQKDYYCGVMSGAKILNPALYGQGLAIDSFMTLAPFGIQNQEPKKTDENIIRKIFPSIKTSDSIVIWGGGIWNWFDPISLIKAFEILLTKREDIKLLFYGFGHPNPKIKKMKMAGDALELSKKNGTFGKNVFFNTEWVEYSERANFLLGSKVGVSTHFNNTETHFSFRTRVLDYLWTELPMVLTRGDYFAELCEKEKLGIVVDFQSPKEIALAIEKLTSDKNLRLEIVENIKKVKKEYYWEKIADDIGKIIEKNRFIKRQVSATSYNRLRTKFYYHWIKKKF